MNLIKELVCAGEASVSIGILQPSYDTTGSGNDESHLVLENHQRIDQNNLQGETPGMKNPLETLLAVKEVRLHSLWSVH